MDKYSIINLKIKGFSNRKIAHHLGVNRKTVGKIWTDYCEAQNQLMTQPDLTQSEKEKLTNLVINRNYNSESRTKRKLTPEVFKRLYEILEDEEVKTLQLGTRHKQKLTCSQIHQILQEEGVDIGLTTITMALREIRESKEVFIKQHYHYGQRLEYDFGEVKLMINGKLTVFYLAVFGSPASGFRWAYLYRTQDQKVFLDSHVRFFEMTKGTWKEVVYDNMRNVVTRFIGRSEKQLNEQLLNMALFYQYEINVTNCFSGNEKGYVESSVKKIRNSVFARHYQFSSYEEACEHLNTSLVTLNQESTFEQEMLTLQPCPVKYELADVEIGTVDKYSCVRVENNFYSVPDYLAKKQVTIKKYIDKILIYSNNEFVCEHKKVNGTKEYQLELSHYLKTLRQKPGALKNSLVIQQFPEIQSIYQTYFKSKPKKFIERLIEFNHLPYHELLEKLTENRLESKTHRSELHESVLSRSVSQLQQITQLRTHRGPYENY